MASPYNEPFLTAMPDLPKHDEFSVLATVHAHPEHIDALEEIYTKTTRRAWSDEEPDTTYYCLARDPEHKDLIHFFERYNGKAGLDFHNDQPVVKKIFEVGMMKGCNNCTFAVSTSLPPPSANIEVNKIDDAALQAMLTHLPPVPEEEFVVYQTLFAHPEQADALAQLSADFVKMAEDEPGTLALIIGRDMTDPTRFLVFERYSGKDACLHHLKRVASHLGKMGGMVREQRRCVALPIKAAKA